MEWQKLTKENRPADDEWCECKTGEGEIVRGQVLMNPSAGIFHCVGNQLLSTVTHYRPLSKQESITVRRFLVFAFSRLDPKGGMNDFIADVETFEEAEGIFESNERIDHWRETGELEGHIFDMYEGQLAWKYEA